LSDAIVVVVVDEVVDVPTAVVVVEDVSTVVVVVVVVDEAGFTAIARPVKTRVLATASGSVRRDQERVGVFTASL